MNSMTLTANLATVGTAFLLMVIAFIFGIIGAIASYVFDFMGGFIAIIAGGRLSYKMQERSMLPVYLRSYLYVAGCTCALVFAASYGMASWSYLLASTFAFCLGVATVKLFK